jgi:hypothetical protein
MIITKQKRLKTQICLIFRLLPYLWHRFVIVEATSPRGQDRTSSFSEEEDQQQQQQQQQQQNNNKYNSINLSRVV